MEEIKNQLIEAYLKGAFLKVLYNIYLQSSEESTDLGEVLSELHNEGNINLPHEFLLLKRHSAEADFFLTRHIFEDALPNLKSPLILVMEYVDHLFVEAGDDLAAGTVFKPFMAFCERDNTRPVEVLKIVKEQDKFYDFIWTSSKSILIMLAT